MNTTSFIQSRALLSKLQSSLQNDTTGTLRQKTESALADFASQLQSLIASSKTDATAAPSSMINATQTGAAGATSCVRAKLPEMSSAGTAEAQNAFPAAGKPDGKAYLLSAGADAGVARNSKPNIREFMQATGVDFTTASSTLYGVIASNGDYRDWSAIMAADNPLAAARAATGAMYSSDSPYLSAGSKTLPADAIKAQAGHFAWVEMEGKKNLWLLDGNNAPLRLLNLDAPSLLRTARDFGIDTAPLSELADQLDAQGVRYRPGTLYAGSDHGVDLKALASGQLGTRFDWTQDPLAHLKGKFALQSLKANQALAAELGIRKLLS